VLKISDQLTWFDVYPAILALLHGGYAGAAVLIGFDNQPPETYEYVCCAYPIDVYNSSSVNPVKLSCHDITA
jgi:hypothetical protein